MKFRSLFQILLLVAFSYLFLMGCTPEKARAVRTAAIQFKTEALAAIEAINVMMNRELESPPRTESAATEEFVTNILELEADTELTSEIIDAALDPYKITLDSELARRREHFNNDLMLQYTSFAAVFKDLEKGSILAKDAVKKSAIYAEKLTIQMAAFAKSITDHPPTLLQYRTTIIDEIDIVRLDSSLSIDEKRKRLVELKEQWEATKAQEMDLQRGVVEKCLKASIIGMQVRRLIDTYDKISLDDLNSIISSVLEEAGDLTGKDFSQLKLKSEEVFAAIEKDPIWSDLAQGILKKTNNLIQSGAE